MCIQIEHLGTFAQLYDITLSSVLKVVTVFFSLGFYHDFVNTLHCHLICIDIIA